MNVAHISRNRHRTTNNIPGLYVKTVIFEKLVVLRELVPEFAGEEGGGGSLLIALFFLKIKEKCYDVINR